MKTTDNPKPGNKDFSPLKRALKALREMNSKLEDMERSRKEPIAVIGMGCRFPGDVNNASDMY